MRRIEVARHLGALFLCSLFACTLSGRDGAATKKLDNPLFVDPRNFEVWSEFADEITIHFASDEAGCGGGQEVKMEPGRFSAGETSGWFKAKMPAQFSDPYAVGYAFEISYDDEARRALASLGQAEVGRDTGTGTRLFWDPQAEYFPEGKEAVFDAAKGDHAVWPRRVKHDGDNLEPLDLNRRKPLESAVMMEAHIGTFTKVANFERAAVNLDTLKTFLRISHIVLMPVHTVSCDSTRGKPCRSWGYDGVALNSVNHAYGGPEGLKAFVKEAHEKRIAVILDLVHSRFGPEGNVLPFFGPYDTEIANAMEQGPVVMTSHGPAPNFDNKQVREHFTTNAKHFVANYGVDGFRVHASDTIYASPGGRDFLTELQREVQGLGKGTLFLADSKANQAQLVREDQDGFDGKSHNELGAALHVLLTGEGLKTPERRGDIYAPYALGRREGRVANTPPGLSAKGARHNALYALQLILEEGFFRKGDDGLPEGVSGQANLVHDQAAPSLSSSTLLASVSSHESIGFRTDGLRPHAVPRAYADEGLPSAPGPKLVGDNLVKVAALVAYTSPFVPLMFQGEPWQDKSIFPFFTSRLSETLAEEERSVPPPPDMFTSPYASSRDHRLFSAAQLSWIDPMNGAAFPNEFASFNFYRKMFEIRAGNPDLQANHNYGGNPGKFQVKVSSKRFVQSDAEIPGGWLPWLVMRRGRFAVLANFSDTPINFGLRTMLNDGEQLFPAAGPTSGQNQPVSSSQVEIELDSRTSPYGSRDPDTGARSAYLVKEQQSDTPYGHIVHVSSESCVLVKLPSP